MYQKIKCTIFNILLLCFGFGLFLFNKVDSYASNAITIEWWNGVYGESNASFKQRFIFSPRSGSRYGAYFSFNSEYQGTPLGSMYIYSNDGEPINGTLYTWSYNKSGVQTSYNGGVSDSLSFSYNTNAQCYVSTNLSNNTFSCSSFISSDINDVLAYVKDGVMPQIPFDNTLKLDSFKVTSWSIGNLQAFFKSKFDVKWSDPRISVVQVRISGTANDVTYESSSSPFNGKFQADNFVFNRGDIIHLVATPFKGDGSYGESLYYSVTYSDNIPFSNNYRKLVNNNVNDNTLTIPYIDTSGNNDNVTVPVDGVSTNITYKVNFNPVTNEYGDLNVYEIYYSPVVVYPDETTENEVDNTQDVIINNYNTTNYYETVQNIDTDFDIDITDVSSGDIQNTYDDIGDFFKGFGSFIGKFALLFNGIFPFLSPNVSVVLVTMVGIIAVGAVVILFLKIFHII